MAKPSDRKLTRVAVSASAEQTTIIMKSCIALVHAVAQGNLYKACRVSDGKCFLCAAAFALSQLQRELLMDWEWAFVRRASMYKGFPV